ncbi:unnamed protein product, partial [Coregonus sp. 'balchen']
MQELENHVFFTSLLRRDIINVVNKYVKLQIWDTAGQERFRSVTRSYYRGAAGALLVYDITSRETYNALTNWLTDARMLASQNIVIILCGNKKDLDADREVTFLEAALTGENVEEAFVQCARKILNKIESGELDPERMGSGIQYGDAALRQLRSPRRGQAESAQDCGCMLVKTLRKDDRCREHDTELIMAERLFPDLLLTSQLPDVPSERPTENPGFLASHWNAELVPGPLRHRQRVLFHLLKPFNHLGCIHKASQ